MSQKVAFFVHHCVFFPHGCANIGREVRLVLPKTYQEIYDTHTCLNFLKNISKCVFILDRLKFKSQCKMIILWRSTLNKKKLAGRSFFSKLGLAGSGARKPRREFEGSALEPFSHFVLRLNGL